MNVAVVVVLRGAQLVEAGGERLIEINKVGRGWIWDEGGVMMIVDMEAEKEMGQRDLKFRKVIVPVGLEWRVGMLMSIEAARRLEIVRLDGEGGI